MSYPAPRSVHNSSTAKALVDTHTLQLEYKPHVKKKKKSEGQGRDTAIWVHGEAVYGHVWMRETGVDTSPKGRYLPYVDG